MIGNIAQFWQLTRELDVNAIRAELDRTPSVRVLGSDAGSAARLAGMIDPQAAGREVQVGLLVDRALGPWERGRPDLYVVGVGSALEAADRRALTELGIGQTPVLLVQLEDAVNVVVVGVPEERVVGLEPGLSEAAARDRVLSALVRLAPEVMLPLGRRYPHLREAVAAHLVLDAARVNAQFAAVSSLPASIPLLGGLVGDMADMLVLTKNQVILLFKLAGLYGRDLDLGTRTIVEVLPVVGGAFFWRTTARTLVGLLPGFVSLLPKALVAYTGTFVVGELARYYYRYGRKAPPEVVRALSAQGLRLARASLGHLGRRRSA